MSNKHSQELAAAWDSKEVTGTDFAVQIGRVLDEHADQLTSLSKASEEQIERVNMLQDYVSRSTINTTEEMARHVKPLGVIERDLAQRRGDAGKGNYRMSETTEAIKKGDRVRTPQGEGVVSRTGTVDGVPRVYVVAEKGCHLSLGRAFNADQVVVIEKAPPKAEATTEPDPTQKSWWAALAATNKLLAAAVEFMHRKAKLLVEHATRLEEHGGRLTVLAQAQRLGEKRLDKHHDRLLADRKRMDGIESRLGGTDAEVATAFQQLADRLDGSENALSGHTGTLNAHRLRAAVSIEERLDAIDKELAQRRGDAEEEEGQAEVPKGRERCMVLKPGLAIPRPEPIGQAWVYKCDDGTYRPDTVIFPACEAGAAWTCVICANHLAHPNVRPKGHAALVNLVPVYSDNEQKEPNA